MPPRRGIKAPIQLLVEGADAQYFFMHFLNHLGFNNVEVQGEVEWRGQSRVYREAPDLIAALGLTDSLDKRDVSAFDRVCSAILDRLYPSDLEIRDFGGNDDFRDFLRAFWNAPGAGTKVEAIGVVRDAETDASAAFTSVRDAISILELTPPDCPMQVVGEKPRVGILILPPGKPNGMLEDVCLDAVRADPAMPCVEKYIECVEENVPDWRERNRKKAKVQAFLASRDEPGLKLGEAALSRYWNWDHEAYDSIRQFIQTLTVQSA